MNKLQKWAMVLASTVTAGMGVASPALAEVSTADVALIVHACFAIDQGEVTEADLTMLDDAEYSALMSACGFVSDGSVPETNMVAFEEYYVVFQEDVVAFETVVEEYTVETSEETVVEEYTEETVVEEYTEETVVEEYTEETVIEEYTEETVIEE